MKNKIGEKDEKNVTIGKIFGNLAFLICYFKIFSITSECMYNPFMYNPFLNGFVLNLIIMFVCIFSFLCFIIQSIKLGYFIETYLIKHKIMKSESEDNII